MKVAFSVLPGLNKICIVSTNYSDREDSRKPKSYPLNDKDSCRFYIYSLIIKSNPIVAENERFQRENLPKLNEMQNPHETLIYLEIFPLNGIAA